jgi:hypothetical protein
MSNRVGLYRYQQWRERHRLPKASLVRRIDPVSGAVVQILPASGWRKMPQKVRKKSSPAKRRRIWRFDDVALRMLDEMGKRK